MPKRGWSGNTNWTSPICLDGYSRLVDITGDGKADIVRAQQNTPTSCTWSFSKAAYLATANGWVQNYSCSPPFCLDEFSKFADVTGDGLVDIVRGGGATKNFVYLTTGSNWSNEPLWK